MASSSALLITWTFSFQLDPLLEDTHHLLIEGMSCRLELPLSLHWSCISSKLDRDIGERDKISFTDNSASAQDIALTEMVLTNNTQLKKNKKKCMITQSM